MTEQAKEPPMPTPTPTLASERPLMGPNRRRPLGESPALDRPESPATKYANWQKGDPTTKTPRDRWPAEVPQRVINILKRQHLYYAPVRARPGEEFSLRHPAHYNPDAMAPAPSEEAAIKAEAERAAKEPISARRSMTYETRGAKQDRGDASGALGEHVQRDKHKGESADAKDVRERSDKQQDQAEKK